MGSGKLRCSDLDQFVAQCDHLGGPQHPAAASYLSDFQLSLDIAVDQDLDPLSEAYFQQQLQVYRAVSGRELNQEIGEQAPVPVDANVATANPYGSQDVHFISKHSRAILTTVLVSNLPPAARVLDVGCGWGLSSEVMAFCGLNVDAVDINPLFVELVRRRALLRKLPVTPIQSAFDNIKTDNTYDLALFYESLHHATKPWETLGRVAALLKPDGKIAFAGEPIQDLWWRNWGLRLDSLSVYCIRKFGWFESGWSRDFIKSCFNEAGFELNIYDGIGLDNGLIGVATRRNATSASQFAHPRPDFAAPAPFAGHAAAPKRRKRKKQKPLVKRLWRRLKKGL